MGESLMQLEKAIQFPLSMESPIERTNNLKRIKKSKIVITQAVSGRREK